MSHAAEQIRVLNERYRQADDANDVEGRVRAITELTTYVVNLKRRDNERAWLAFDQRQKVRP